MTDTTFTDSYILTDALLETALGADPRAAAIALKAASAASQLWYCQKATAAIDRLSFSGYKLVHTQDRQFPRKYLADPETVSPWSAQLLLIDIDGYTYESSDVPDVVLEACKEEAIAIYAFYSAANVDSVERERLREDGVLNIGLGSMVSEQLSPASLYGKYGLRSQDAIRLLEPFMENAPLIV